MGTNVSKALTTILFLSAAACGGGAIATSAASAPDGATASATPREAPRANRAMVAKIDAFLADPSQVSPTEIVRFVSDSPDVVVVARAPLVLLEDAPKDEGALLLAAFAAGNARAQLVSGRKKDSPVDGVRGMLAVYRWLKAHAPGLRIAKLEELASRDSAGDLASRVEELAR